MRFTYPERIRRLIDLPERDQWQLSALDLPPPR
jgi:hypothetical protein